MPVNFRITSTNLKSTIRGLDRTRNRISDFAPFWRSVAIPIIKDRLRITFAQEGPGWAPLAESTLRIREDPTAPILQQSRALITSVINHPVLEISRKNLLYGTANPYAQFHEHGTSRMPARPFLRPSIQKAMQQIRREYIQYIRQDRLRF